MFSKETYITRRAELKKLTESGLILIFGNNDSPANYPANAYKFRQDSTFLYFFGWQRDGLVGVIDVDNDREYFVGDEIDIDDIVWYGSVTSVGEKATRAGDARTAKMRELQNIIDAAKSSGQEIHFLPPYRFDTKIQIMDLLGLHPAVQKEAASRKLIDAVVKLRSTKSEEEIAELERAARIGYEMHTAAMRLCSPETTEQYIGGVLDGIASSYGCMVSFPSIVTMHGEILHGYPSPRKLEAGRLLLVDAGAETNNNYCSDNTRTTPISGTFTQKQRDIYTIVEECHDLALQLAKPEVKYRDVHFAAVRVILEGLSALGLVKGNLDDAVEKGVHALFMPHGLGHMMGLDVHDMEDIGEKYVGYDLETERSNQLGVSNLRMARRLQTGMVMTDEPGIYFIPAYIAKWKNEGLNKEFINFDKLEPYMNFGGVRIEDDLLITETGNRILGKRRIPVTVEEIETFMAGN